MALNLNVKKDIGFMDDNSYIYIFDSSLWSTDSVAVNVYKICESFGAIIMVVHYVDIQVFNSNVF